MPFRSQLNGDLLIAHRQVFWQASRDDIQIAFHLLTDDLTLLSNSRISRKGSISRNSLLVMGA